jgi:hypothetical protein
MGSYTASGPPDIQDQADKLLLQASEIGLSVLIWASAFWKEGKEKVAKVMEERSEYLFFPPFLAFLKSLIFYFLIKARSSAKRKEHLLQRNEEFEEILEDDGDSQWEDEDSTMGWDNLFITVDSDSEE